VRALYCVVTSAVSVSYT